MCPAAPTVIIIETDEGLLKVTGGQVKCKSIENGAIERLLLLSSQ